MIVSVCLCPCFHLLSQLKRGKEPCLTVLVFCVSPAHRGCGKPQLIRGMLCACCQHPQGAVPLSLGALGCSALLLVQGAASEVAAVSLSQGRGSRSPGWLQARGSPRLEQAATLLNHLTGATGTISDRLRNPLFICSPSGFHISAGAVKQISNMNKVIKFVSKRV